LLGGVGVATGTGVGLAVGAEVGAAVGAGVGLAVELAGPTAAFGAFWPVFGVEWFVNATVAPTAPTMTAIAITAIISFVFIFLMSTPFASLESLFNSEAVAYKSLLYP